MKTTSYKITISEDHREILFNSLFDSFPVSNPETREAAKELLGMLNSLAGEELRVPGALHDFTA